jgi:hypothetical protein
VTRRARAFNLIVLAVGAIALALFVNELGWERMVDAIADAGWWFAVMAAIDFASALCDAFAVHGFLRKQVTISYAKVFGAQISGIAINRLTPGNSLGEPVKVTMLVRYVPTDAAVAAIVMFNLSTYFVGIASIAIGVPTTALLLDLPPRIALFAWIAVAVLVVAALILAIVVKRGAIGTLIDGLGGSRVISAERATRWRARVADIDARVRSLAKKESGIHRGLAGVIGSRLLNWLGTIVCLHAAAIQLHVPLVVAALSIGILVTWVSNVIPFGLVIADGANYMLYDLLGATAWAGLVFTNINRVRTILLATMGLVVMAIANALYRAQRT